MKKEETEELTKKQKGILKAMDILIIVVAIISICVIIYSIINKNNDSFSEDYDNLVTECQINSCTDSEFNEKLDALKKKSNLTEEEIEKIIEEK